MTTKRQRSKPMLNYKIRELDQIPYLASSNPIINLFYPLISAPTSISAKISSNLPTKIPCSTFVLRLPFSHSCDSTLKSSKPTLIFGLPTSKKLEFIAKNFVFERKRVLGPYRMTELTQTSTALKFSVGHEGSRMIQEESFLHGSSRLESILNKLSKWLVTSVFCLVMVVRHDSEALWAAMGIVVNSITCVVLKRRLNQERPISTRRSDPGMPSSHAQSISFIAIFIILSIEEWLGINPLSLTLSALTFVLASYLAWLRVSQQLHTTSQVVVGAVFGSVFSVVWFLYWKASVSKAFVAYLWVRVVVFLGASGFCLGFIVYVIKNLFGESER